MRVLPYSYSSLTSFENCAFKHYKVKVSKEVKEQQYQAAADGIDIHKQAEDYIKSRVPFEGKYAPKVISTVSAMLATGNPIHAEHQLAVTRDMKPTGWWDENCHSRGVLDVYQVNGTTAEIKDWKTGKSNAFTQQLKHNALLVFIHEPAVQTVNYEYVWLKEGFSTKGKVHRDFLQAHWDSFEKRVIIMEKALVENKWPKKPSGLCRQYCPVTECEHNGQYAKTF